MNPDKMAKVVDFICKKDAELPVPGITFTTKRFGLRNKAKQLERAIFRIGVCVGVNCLTSSHSFIGMITASHNPPQDNGIKIGFADFDKLPCQLLQQIQNFINIGQSLSQQTLTKYLNNKFEGIKDLSHNFVYVGQDTRPTSQQLSFLFKSSVQLFAQNIIDFGQLTTPQLFAISKLCSSNKLNQYLPPIEIRNNFYQQVLDSFDYAMQALNFKNKKHIYMDFANGVGAVSFKYYQKRLEKYFKFKIVNDHKFDLANVKCGAEYYEHHPEQLPQKGYFNQLYYFDGDCDRIILQIQQKNQPLANGQVFNSIYVSTLKKLLGNIKANGVKQGAVSNILANYGFSQFLRAQGIEYVKAQVGVSNLFEACKKFDVASYFESNGHGGIFVNPKLAELINAKQQKTLQDKIFIALLTISSNTCKGYALHNFLCLQICILYLNLSQQDFFLFSRCFQKQQSFFVKNFEEYKTTNDGQSLSQPKKISQQIQKIKSKYLNCNSIVRPSGTQEKIRIAVQGAQKECNLYFQELKQIFRDQLIQ